MVREKEDIYHFCGEDELEINVTDKSAEDTAHVICEFISQC